MIWVLTIINAILLVWSVVSALMCMDTDNAKINLDYDGLLVTLAKLYWWGIGTLLVLAIVLGISYFISYESLCNVSNNDNKVCSKNK